MKDGAIYAYRCSGMTSSAQPPAYGRLSGSDIGYMVLVYTLLEIGLVYSVVGKKQDIGMSDLPLHPHDKRSSRLGVFGIRKQTLSPLGISAVSSAVGLSVPVGLLGCRRTLGQWRQRQKTQDPAISAQDDTGMSVR
ncbi:hypothetical protein ASPSYDRAFT_375466 [Aspergillus sydowii CBS 593.65]|uniref:Uncharacterized protein n=1 Tax=Aspergillus sydowii CBS 593.65 TaxID=1036612 RepID=A0A1L9U0N3_9EURO|nr:uncharacterized protein ASPSYDRAFT_375466 [Aspergillus sydowii CBS 593.65]OJJ65219.1 hypothetical protein ASPSYDRAFT_375466 [Aspergillus sydowii CBS 593.65]